MRTRLLLSSLRLAALCGMAQLFGSAAAAQGTNTVIRTVLDESPTSVQVGEYYTQVLFSTSTITVPSDDRGKKQLGNAILTAFGLNDRTRSLTVSAVLTRSGQSLPEVPLVTYSFDGKRRLTNYERVGAFLSPRWQLGASDPISLTLKYKYSETATYNPGLISDNVRRLIPSDAIVSTLSTPFVQSIAGLTASIFEIAGSRSVDVRNKDDLLLPYSGAVGARGITYKLSLPNGAPLGEIRAILVVSPSLLRPAVTATAARPTDMRRQPMESVAAIALDVAGARKNLLQELEGTNLYAAMTRDPTPASVRGYCSRAMPVLATYDVTRLDRVTLVYQSLLDAGLTPGSYHPAVNGWLRECYSDAADRAALTAALAVDFTPPAPPLAPQSAEPREWSTALKSAMGCWITRQTGTWCQHNAPDGKATLDRAMANTIAVGVIELSDVNLSAMPFDRQWDKASLLAALDGRAERFSCFTRGLIITKDQVAYSLNVSFKEGAIVSLQILRASPEEEQCLIG